MKISISRRFGIATGLMLTLLNGTALAQIAMDDSAPNSSSDQMGMASKDSANRDGMVKGMPQAGSAAALQPTMDNSAPLSGSDQEGAAGKDSVNSEPLNTGPAQ